MERKDLQLDLRKLGVADKPGAWTDVDVTVAAPEDLRNEMIGVPEGNPLTVRLRLESVVDGIYASGTFEALAKGQDARTLEDLELPLSVDVQELFVYERGEDEDSYAVERDKINLEPLIRDAVVMALPLNPVESDDDGEFSYTVGEFPEDEEAGSINDRLAALKHQLEKKES